MSEFLIFYILLRQREALQTTKCRLNDPFQKLKLLRPYLLVFISFFRTMKRNFVFFGSPCILFKTIFKSMISELFQMFTNFEIENKTATNCHCVSGLFQLIL